MKKLQHFCARAPFALGSGVAATLVALSTLAGCGSTGAPGTQAPVVAAKPATVVVAPAASPRAAPTVLTPLSATTTATTPATTTAAAVPAPNNNFVAPAPVRFEEAIARAGQELFAQARVQLGNEARSLVIDPLIDANTGGQTVSTAKMGSQLESIVKTQQVQWQLKPLTRQSLADKPLLLIGTLTPVNVERAVDTPPDAFRVWLTLIDLRTGRVVAKQLDRATIDSVNAEPLKFYADSPTWHKDKTVIGYINSCQINTKIGDPADPDYLARLPAAAIINEAILAYGEGKTLAAQKLYKEADGIADRGDLRVLNGLYLTSWQLGQRDAAKQVFLRLVESGLELKRLPVKLLFQPGRTAFNQVGDLPQQYQMWIGALAQESNKANACVRVVGHTSRTGSARANETLSRQRAELVQKLLEQNTRALSARLSASGVGSKEALVGLGTDDLRDALDRRVEFRVIDCV
jgi:outer membrane protein OmpA-like peptidoglycan-associated protein